MSVFKACDIRGVAGRELTPDIYVRIGRGIARMAGAPGTVVVGGDLRVSTPELKAALIRGLSEGGCRVSDIGLVPTPVVYFAKKRLGADACAIVTASHNPPKYNGLKFMIGAMPVLPEDMEKLRRFVEREAAEAPVQKAARAATPREILPAYEEWVLHAARRLSGGVAPAERALTVVLDAGNGSYSEIAPRVLGNMAGVRVVRLFCKPDGRFPNRDPNCAVPKNLVALGRRVREDGADAGIAFDGDGDRVAFTDERGEVLSSDEVFLLLLRHWGTRLGGEKVVYDLKCSQAVAREASRLGARPIMERSGHASIKGRMIAENAALGGEVSGHFFYRELEGGDDGLFSALLGVGILRAAGVSLGELRRGLPARYITNDIRIPWAAGHSEKLLASVREAFPVDRRTELDGIRVTFSRGWGLIRRSITEPKLTLRFEGEDAASLRQTMEAFLAPFPELRRAVKSAMRSSEE